MYYIYKIENMINHKTYIGLSNNITRRLTRHFTDLKCNRHDNHFLQKEYNIYGKDAFSVNIEFSGEVTAEEISEQEKYFIKKYDSYRNGYNQNEGGNFGPSNGGTQFTQSDIINILSVLEFMSKPGQILSDIYGVSRTTISRIKRGVNHNQYKEEYENYPLEYRKEIFDSFCKINNLIEKKAQSTIITSKRKLSKEQVFMIFYNDTYKIIPLTALAKKIGIKSTNTITTILKGLSYKDYAIEYQKLSNEEKEKIASLLRN